MDIVSLGHTGLKVSRLCLGCMTYGSPTWRDWVLSEEQSRPFIRRALEAGINFFDTADIYSLGASEEILGRALKEFRAPRDSVVIASKVYFPLGDRPNLGGLSAKHILDAIDASLKRLGTDYLDLYQIHRFDPEVPMEETVEALDAVVRAGKARYIGASSMYAWQFAKYLGLQRQAHAARFVSMQNFYNLVYREEEREMIPLCGDQGVGVIPWSPLARGFLGRSLIEAKAKKTARAKSDAVLDMEFDDNDLATLGAVERIARARGVPNAQVALAWLLAKPFVTAPIVGASKPHHLEDAIAAASLKLSGEDMAALEAHYRPKKVAGNLR